MQKPLIYAKKTNDDRPTDQHFLVTLIWKKVEIRRFEDFLSSAKKKLFSLFFMGRLRKLISFGLNETTHEINS